MAFQVGDLVEYNGHIAEIKELDKDVPYSGGLKGALVEWSNKSLAPPQMIIPYKDLLYVGTNNKSQPNLPKGFGSEWADLLEDTGSINTDERCPICDTEWIETWINKEPFYDCKKCNATKEKIMDQYVGDITNLDFSSDQEKEKKELF